MKVEIGPILAAVNRVAEGRALLFWCREPDKKLTWVFPRHHRLLLPLRRQARTAKSVIGGTPHLLTAYRRRGMSRWKWSTNTAVGSISTKRPWWRAWSCLDLASS